MDWDVWMMVGGGRGLTRLFHIGFLRIRHSSYPQAVSNLAQGQVENEGTRYHCRVCDHLPPEWQSQDGVGGTLVGGDGVGTDGTHYLTLNIREMRILRNSNSQASP